MLTYAIPNEAHLLHLTYMLTALLSVLWVIGFMLLENLHEEDRDFFGLDKSFDDEFTERPSNRDGAARRSGKDV